MRSFIYIYFYMYLSQPANQLISIIHFETCSHPLVDTRETARLLPGKQLLLWLPLHYFLYSRGRTTTTKTSFKNSKSSFPSSAPNASDTSLIAAHHHNLQPATFRSCIPPAALPGSFRITLNKEAAAAGGIVIKRPSSAQISCISGESFIVKATV